MTFLPFLITFGFVLVMVALVAAWQYRVAKVHVVWRLLLPVVLVAMAVATPFQVSKMMGFPVETVVANMPKDAHLIAFLAHDQKNLVDLWVVAQGEAVRSYEVELTPQLKKVLTEARESLQKGEPVYLKAKNKSKETGILSNSYVKQSQQDAPEYEIDNSRIHVMPPKDAEQ